MGNGSYAKFFLNQICHCYCFFSHYLWRVLRQISQTRFLPSWQFIIRRRIPGVQVHADLTPPCTQVFICKSCKVLIVCHFPIAEPCWNKMILTAQILKPGKETSILSSQISSFLPFPQIVTFCIYSYHKIFLFLFHHSLFSIFIPAGNDPSSRQAPHTVISSEARFFLPEFS